MFVGNGIGFLGSIEGLTRFFSWLYFSSEVLSLSLSFVAEIERKYECNENYVDIHNFIIIYFL